VIPVEHFLIVGAVLFCAGLMTVITKRNNILILIGIELMLNGSNVNFVAFSRYDESLLQGQVFALFVMVIAAAEAAVGLAIILKVYEQFKTVNPDVINQMKK
jgi:NADH:ubiquinone oxidoreductase subunit K